MSTALKATIKRWLWPLMPSWPDEGRRIVQGSHLRVFLQRAARDRYFRRVFNAGAGEGGYSPMLLELPGVQSVVESDYGYGSHQPGRIHPKQVFFGASLASIPLADNTMDLILCTEVLEHIQEHEQALDEITRVMAPSGWLLITVPTPPAPWDPAHVREGYRREELAAMLTQRGFEIVESRFCMHFFFQFLLAHFWKLPWCPRIVTRGLANLDKLLPLGSPMDLLILAKLTDSKAPAIQRANETSDSSKMAEVSRT